MSVKVTTNRHGYLGLRVGLKGRRYWIGTKHREADRRLVEAKSVLLDEALRSMDLHEALLEVLGGCPARLLPETHQTVRRPQGVTLREYFDEWIKRKSWPAVRESAARKYRWSFNAHILPKLGSRALRGIGRADLLALRARLLDGGNGRGGKRSVKTVRNILDWHFRALWNDALADELVDHNPFTTIRWPRMQQTKPDPFEADDRDRILAWFGERDPYWFPWIYFLFWTGMRHGEAAALRWSDVDLKRQTISITKSRDARREASPKTYGSTRDIALLPWVAKLLSVLPRQLHSDGSEYVFVTPEGRPMTDTWWPKRGASWRDKSDDKLGLWYRGLRSLGIRPRTAYTTRHTFISWALSRPGCNLKGLAEYCGTSVQMIERHYGKYMRRDFLTGLVEGENGNLGGNPEVATKQKSRESRPFVMEAGGIEPPSESGPP